MNCNLGFDYVFKHINYSWDWDLLSRNMNVNLRDIIEHSELTDELSIGSNDSPAADSTKVCLPSESSDSRDSNPARICLPWNYTILTHNPNLSEDEVLFILESSLYTDKEYVDPNLPLETFYTKSKANLSELLSPNIIFDQEKSMIQNVLEKCYSIRFSKNHLEIWNSLSHDSGIRLQDIIDYPQLPWNWALIMVNPNIFIRDIKNYPKLPWDLRLMGLNPNVTVQDIKDNPGLPWKFSHIAYNLFEKHPVIAKKWVDKYKPKSEEFKSHLKSWKNHLKYQPDKEGYTKTKEIWEARK